MAETFGHYLAVQGVVQKKELGKFANSWGVSEKRKIRGNFSVFVCLFVCKYVCVCECV